MTLYAARLGAAAVAVGAAVATAAALATAPALVGFAMAAAMAIGWTVWLDRHPDA